MERLPAVAKCYGKWLELQEQVQGYYTGEAIRRVPLSQQKEFRSIKNAVVQEAERLRLGEFTFEERQMPELEELDEPKEAHHTHGNYRQLRDIICNETLTLKYRDYAAEQMREFAEEGHPYAQHLMGELLLSDDRDMRSPAEGIRWLETAFQNGSHYAGYRLGEEYLRGEVVQKDVPKALNYLGKAADQGQTTRKCRLTPSCAKSSGRRK